MTSPRKRNPFMLPLFLVPLALSAATLLAWLVIVPRPLFPGDFSRVVYDRSGRLLAATISSDEQWRFPLSDAPLPPRYVEALLRYEDERFFRHPGVDPIAIARAIVSNAEAGEIVSGGSTITMQLARLARGSRPRTYRQKLAEASLALRLELTTPKEKILRLFAEHAPFGGNVVGIEAASWRYFGRPLGDVTWAEAALLAVLPNSPSLMHLSQRRDELVAKRNRLLERLHDAGTIDEEALRLALSEPIPGAPRAIPQSAPQLLQTLASDHPDRWRFDTTIDDRLQTRVSEILNQYGRQLRASGVNHAAAIVIDVATGDVLAYLGNLDARDPAAEGDFVDIIRSPRSTGSVLKPILYASMLDAGEILPHQIVADVPTRIGGYIPENYTHVYTGAIRVDEALARSLNVPAARLLRDFGVSRFYGVLEDAGMTTLVRPASEYGIPLVLGGAESTLWELAGIYASMARTVVRRDAHASFFMPTLLPGDASPARDAPMSPAALYLTMQALNEVARPEEFLGWQNFSSAHEVSWKTGTSYGLRDAWAIGVTDRYAVGVWAGNASGAGAPGLRGSASAGPILFQIFELLDSGAGFLNPGGMRTVRVCSQSGLLAGPDCATTELAEVPDNGRDLPVCTYCTILHLDAAGTYQVTSDIYPVAQMRNESWFVLPAAMAWYYQQQATDYVPPPPFDPRVVATVNPLTIEFPLPRARVVIPIEMDGNRGSIVARAHTTLEGERLFWHLDGEYLGETDEVHTFELAPPAGDHVLTIVDTGGNTREVHFSVLE